MKCQEVMIYMQRQLDGDLAPNEEDELHAHLMHCLDCAQMFERLQALSDELSHLPKVKPPFSLVDAIMPQLLELDKQSGSLPVSDQVVVPFHSTSERATHEAGSKIPKRSRLREQFSWKIASGVVAAGLILGFFAFNMQHPVLDNADGILKLTSSSNSSSKADSPKAAASEMSRAQDSADLKKQDTATSKQASPESPIADSFVKEKDGTIPQASAASGSKPQATTDAMVEKPSTYTAPVGGKEAMSNQTSPSTSAPEPMKEPSDTDVGNNSSDTIGISSASGSTTQTGDESKNESRSKKTAPATTEGPKSVDQSGTNASITNLTAPQNGSILKSTSGAYSAAVEDSHVVIRDNQTLEIVFASKQVWQATDEIRLIEWSKDDKLFYQVTSEGTVQTLLIDVIGQTEANK